MRRLPSRYRRTPTYHDRRRGPLPPAKPRSEGTTVGLANGLAVEIFERQRRSFFERFGRQPIDTDPIFFDRDAPGDEPTFMSPEQTERFRQAVTDFQETVRADHAIAAAAKATGIVPIAGVSEHLYSAAEIAAFHAAVAAARGSS